MSRSDEESIIMQLVPEQNVIEVLNLVVAVLPGSCCASLCVILIGQTFPVIDHHQVIAMRC